MTSNLVQKRKLPFDYPAKKAKTIYLKRFRLFGIVALTNVGFIVAHLIPWELQVVLVVSGIGALIGSSDVGNSTQKSSNIAQVRQFSLTRALRWAVISGATTAGMLILSSLITLIFSRDPYSDGININDAAGDAVDAAGDAVDAAGDAVDAAGDAAGDAVDAAGDAVEEKDAVTGEGGEGD